MGLLVADLGFEPRKKQGLNLSRMPFRQSAVVLGAGRISPHFDDIITIAVFSSDIYSTFVFLVAHQGVEP